MAILMPHEGNKIAEEAKAQGKINLRASTIEQFVRCPWQYYQIHILGNDKRRPSAAAALGTAVHYGAEVALKEKMETGKLPPLSVVQDATHESWMKQSEDEDMEYNTDGGENFNSIEAVSQAGSTLFYKDLAPIIEPVGVETVYTKELDNHPIFHSIQGSMDIVEERGVQDLKVTKDKTTASKHILQLGVYAYLRELNGETVTYAGIPNIIKGRKMDASKVRAENIAVKVAPDYAKFHIDKIIRVTEKFHKTGDEDLFHGTSPSNSFLCNEKWCSVWDSCPHTAGLRKAVTLNKPKI